MMLKYLRSKEFATLYLVFLSLTTLVAWVNANPPKAEQFASVSVLGPSKTAAQYFPNNSSQIKTGEVINWYIQVYNHMESAELFFLNIKIGNQSLTDTPNAPTNTPSAGFTILQSYQVVLNNDTWIVPLQWWVVNNTINGNSVVIGALQVNTSTAPAIGISAVFGKNFRIIIELWSYDVQLHEFLFSFRSGGVVYSLWNQQWFDLT